MTSARQRIKTTVPVFIFFPSSRDSVYICAFNQGVCDLEKQCSSTFGVRSLCVTFFLQYRSFILSPGYVQCDFKLNEVTSFEESTSCFLTTSANVAKVEVELAALLRMWDIAGFSHSTETGCPDQIFFYFLQSLQEILWIVPYSGIRSLHFTLFTVHLLQTFVIFYSLWSELPRELLKNHKEMSKYIVFTAC